MTISDSNQLIYWFLHPMSTVYTFLIIVFTWPLITGTNLLTWFKVFVFWVDIEFIRRLIYLRWVFFDRIFYLNTNSTCLFLHFIISLVFGELLDSWDDVIVSFITVLLLIIIVVGILYGYGKVCYLVVMIFVH